MVRGRAGATGAAFNLGEVTVTRCSIALAHGRVGHAWVQGTGGAKARLSALCDALMQGPEAAAVEAAVLAPLRVAEAARRRKRADRAAATKVEFSTMVRGGTTDAPEALADGFADPAGEAARAFRAALDAMARPGRIHRVAGAEPPSPMPVAAIRGWRPSASGGERR